jgi:hypothetical protein
MLPEIFENVFLANSQLHSHNTRQSQNIHLSHVENKYGQLKIKHQGALIWNSLPIKIRKSQTVKNFGKKVKQFYITSY